MSSSPGCAEKGKRKEAVHETGDSLGGEGKQRRREDIALQATQEKLIIHQVQMEFGVQVAPRAVPKALSW